MSYRVAVVGATGAVGQEMLEVLERRAFPIRELRLLASERSAGRELTFRGAPVAVELLCEESLRGLDVALFSAGSAISKQYAPTAASSGVLVIDNSSAFRMEPHVPLCVPEINPHVARGLHQGIVANPNCTTIISLMALAPIHRLSPIVRFTAASYQAASGAGARALAELEAQVKAHAAGEPLPVEVFPHQLAFNCLPHVDAFLDDGYTKEEWKMLNESRKILEHPDLRCSVTCVRVPVLRSHAVAIHLETEAPLELDAIRAALGSAAGVTLQDEPKAGRYPTPLSAAGQDDVFVGRIRRDMSHPNGAALWVAGDQLLKGAALNAVQCAEVAFSIGAFDDASPGALA